MATSCTASSGSSFPVGSTAVTCTAVDAERRSASCAFQVTVTRAPRLTVTRFVAFGDSITAGQLDPPCQTFTLTGQPGLSFLDDLSRLSWAIDPVRAYPNQLLEQLRSRYPAQAPTVINEGLGGECPIGCGPTGGVDRLPGVLAADAPEVLLLQEGINNINSNLPSAIPNVILGLTTMVRQAKAAGVPVLLGTLLPERAGACRGYAPALVDPANAAIKSMAMSEGVPVVDLWAAFGGEAGSLIGNDGLHPSEAGYQKIAATFLEEIKNRYEEK